MFKSLFLTIGLAQSKFYKITDNEINSFEDRGVIPSSIPNFSNDISFALLADPQFGMYNSAIDGGDGLDYQDEFDNFELTMEKLDAMEPKLDFALILGDMTNQMPIGGFRGNNPHNKSEGYPGSHDVQAQAIIGLMDSVDLPIFVLPGNHDIGNDFNQTALDTYERDFGLDYYYFKTEDAVFMNMEAEYFRSEFASMPEKTDEEWAWIERKFQDWSLDETIKKVFFNSHYALFLEDVDEQKGTSWPKDNRDKLLELVEIYFNSINKPVYFYSGHTHTGGDTNEFMKNMNAVSTTKILDDEGKAIGLEVAKHGGVRLVKSNQDKVISEWFETSEIPGSYPAVDGAGMIGFGILALIQFLI